ncbi:MAG TPA: hypothetical protein VIC33_06880 [Vicinamibacterales bacterium]|jgi:hypothetical protein
MLETLSQLIAAWAALFGSHAVLRTAVDFAHIGGLVTGGGCAIAADRATLMAARQAPEVRSAQLSSLRQTHRIVLIALAFVAASGVLLFASDVDTFLPSRMFWLKLGLVALLLANGAWLLRLETRAQKGGDGAWTALRCATIASLSLWLLTTLAGVALTNI